MNAFPHIEYAARTDVGRKRKNNEDAFGAFPDAGVFCVADGMGGGDDGEIASAAVVKSVGEFAASHIPPPGVGYSVEDVAAGVSRAVNDASAWISARAVDLSLKGCGSTFVCACFDATNPSRVIALHAGDSRLYRVHGSSIKQITKDHSAAEMIGAKNESAVNPRFRGVILRAVGIHPSVDVERTPFKAGEDDRIVICSDGLCKMVEDGKIAAIVRDSATPATAADSLVSAANKAGGEDNVTAIVIFVGRLPPPAPSISMPLPAAPGIVAEDARVAETSGDGPGGGCETDADAADEPITIATMSDIPECHCDPPAPNRVSGGVSRRRFIFRIAVSALAVAAIGALAAICGINLAQRAKIRAAAVETARQNSVKALAGLNASARRKTDDKPGARTPERGLEFGQSEDKGVANGFSGPAERSAAGIEDDRERGMKVLPRLVKSCDPSISEEFVKTVRRLPVKGGVEILQTRFRPLCDESLPVARRIAIAADITADVQEIAVELRGYSERRLKDISAALAEHTTRPEFAGRLESERKGLAAFMEATERFAGMDASSAEAQTACAEIMSGIANWFRLVD